MKDYMQRLIWTMLFVIIIEMIFPDSAYKKYLKLVMGCIIIYTLFTPLMVLIPYQNKTYDIYVAEYQHRFAAGIQGGGGKGYEEEVNKQQALLKETYEQNMKRLIEREIEVEVLSIQIEWQEDQREWQVSTITLVVGEKAKGEGAKITIPKIKIGEKSDTLDGDEENLKNKIKTCLKNFYNVQVCNIYITVQKN